MSTNDEAQAESTQQFEGYRVGDTESPSETVVQAVSSATGQDPMDLPFLYETVDPDALNRLLNASDDDSNSLCVSFEYADHYVAVEPDRVLIRPITDE